MKKNKNYVCVGFSFNNINEHLLGKVGETHNIYEWLQIAFPNKSKEFTMDYFNGWSSEEIKEYLFKYMRIRLKNKK